MQYVKGPDFLTDAWCAEWMESKEYFNAARAEVEGTWKSRPR